MFDAFKNKIRSPDPKYKMIFDESTIKNPDFFNFEHNGEIYSAIFEGVILEDEKGYIELRMTIAQENNIVGYIKTFHIPEQSFRFLYPDVLHWANKFKGLNINLSRHPRDLEYSEEKIWEHKNYNEKISALTSGFNHVSYAQYKRFQKRSETGNIDTEKEYALLNKLITTLYGKEFNAFHETFNKSQVQFSRIYDGNEKDHNINSPAIRKYCELKNITDFGATDDSVNNYQGKGLAKKMYKLMADYLGLNDLILTKGFVNDKSSPIWEYKIKNSSDFNYINIDGVEMVDHSKKDLTYLLTKKELLKQITPLVKRKKPRPF